MDRPDGCTPLLLKFFESFLGEMYSLDGRGGCHRHEKPKPPFLGVFQERIGLGQGWLLRHVVIISRGCRSPEFNPATSLMRRTLSLFLVGFAPANCSFRHPQVDAKVLGDIGVGHVSIFRTFHPL